jgi:mxaJ protein
MSSGFNRRHVALAAVGAVVFAAALAARLTPFTDTDTRPEPRNRTAGALPTEVAVQAEEIPAALATSPSARTLRVCADPNNLPFSNARGEGFENKIAELAARNLGRQLQYYWQPQRRGFIRTTLRAGTCDLVMGLLTAPASAGPSAMVQTTKPYYRSSYVFASRHDRNLHVHSFDDPQLAHLRIGIQVTGDDYGNPPPAQALASRGIVQNIRGFTVYGDYSKPDPQRSVIAAVQDGTVDVAIVWGPVAGYFGHQGVPVDVAMAPASDGPNVPFAFNISMGVRRGDEQLRAALNRLIAQHGPEIRRILDEFHVPLLDRQSGPSS